MPEWTNEQKRAIEARGHTVLVSAAAGSGKTTVLIERILRRVCDENPHIAIDKFLIVTFTRAAAAEMREKISNALTERLLQEPNSHELRSQLSRLSRADILTTDAFCTKLLREHFQDAGLTPDFRVLDENEASALQSEVLEDLIEENYENPEHNPGFLALVEALSAARDDRRLGAVILELYRKLQSHPFPEKWLEQNLRDMEAAAQIDPADNIYGKTVLSELADVCAYYAARLAQACAEIEAIPAVKPKYMPAFSQDLARCRALLAGIEAGGWDEVRELLLSASEKMKLSAVQKFEDKALLAALQDVRNDYHDDIGKFADGPFAADAEKTREDCAAILPVMEALTQAVSDFMDAFARRKRANNVLDFSDLEHFALDLLIAQYNPDGSFTPTALAQTLAERYEEIAVDEFQDSNLVQDLIFRALSREEQNLFIVGDVKQSIYGFRLADPEVFMEKYRRFSPDPEPGQGERILLSRNYRSRAEVVDAVNYLFTNILSPSLGGISYGEGEALVHGASYPEKPKGENDAVFLLVEDPEDGRNKLQFEADAVAARIRKMLDEGFTVYDDKAKTLRPCRAEDFAILLRSVQDRTEVYAAALAKVGIPVFTENAGELFDGVEVMGLMALCEVVDNPDNDVALAAVLHGPVYAFSADELADVRLCAREGSFYAALRAAAEQDELTDDADMRALREKCRGFLSDLSAFRSRARDARADELIGHILLATNFIGRFGSVYGAEFSRERLQAFLAAASRCESAGYRGLYAFVSLMRTLRDGRGIPAPAQAQGAGVRIMSIHKSKGLEFPIVIVSSLDTAFNMQDLREPVLIHSSLGAGFTLRPEGRMIEYPTLARHAVSMTLRRETLSEQMRILYVALTRAQEKLILVGAGKAESLVKKYQPLSALSPIPAQALRGCSAFLPWIVTPLLRLPAAAQLMQEAGFPRAPAEEENHAWTLYDVSPAQPDAETAQQARRADPDALPIPKEEFYRRLDFVYPYREAADMPSKLTATGLKGRFADAEVRDEARELQRVRRTLRAQPRALSQQRLTPAQRGTALHMAMQFLDFAQTDSREAIEAQVKAMAEKKLLSPEAAQAVDAERLEAFFLSELGQKVKAAEKLRREFKFSLLADTRALRDPAYLALVPEPDADTILFQGVVDCFFEEEAGITLLDFKSDRVTQAAADETAKSYAPQLEAYACALSRITGKSVKAKYLYFFNLNLAYPL